MSTSAGCAASSATTRSPRFVHTVRGVGFRFAAPEEPSRKPAPPLLLALAYVLLLAIVALEVPLALDLRDRVDAEVRPQARSQADVVAATVDRPARAIPPSCSAPPRRRAQRRAAAC